MDEPRRPRRATHRPGRPTPRGPSYSSRKRRWWRPFGLTPNQIELLIGLILVLVLAVAQFLRSASLNLDGPLELVGLTAIALALGWGIYVIGKRVWTVAFRSRPSRSRAPAQIDTSGPWIQRQGSTPSTILPFESRPAFGVKARVYRRLPIIWLVVVGLAGGAIAGCLAFGFLPGFGIRSSTVASSISFRPCGSLAEENCVVDGDTIYWDGVKIRLADIDTPEISSPKCSSELALGQMAKSRLLELLNTGPFEVSSGGGRDEDGYGRKLRLLTRNGQSLGDTLITEGLARPWDGARRSWC